MGLATVPVRRRCGALRVGRREAVLIGETEQGQITVRRADCQFTEADGNEVPAVELLCQT